ncbi:DUF6783 domain-containing protein [uncultured Robinsoniella sp.]
MVKRLLNWSSYTVKWGVQVRGMHFRIHSGVCLIIVFDNCFTDVLHSS